MVEQKTNHLFSYTTLLVDSSKAIQKNVQYKEKLLNYLLIKLTNIKLFVFMYETTLTISGQGH